MVANVDRVHGHELVPALLACLLEAVTAVGVYVKEELLFRALEASGHQTTSAIGAAPTRDVPRDVLEAEVMRDQNRCQEKQGAGHPSHTLRCEPIQIGHYRS